MRLALFAALALTPAPLLAADEPSPRIMVTGTASVSTPPDRVNIVFTLHGEGATSDEAVAAMVAKRKAIEAGIAGAARAEARTATVNVAEVRGPGCARPNYPYQPRLSTGECAIVGYAADQAMELRTAAVKDAGTIVGLVGRLGGTNPRIERFFLSDDGPARARATAAALAEAQSQAQAIASGAKLTLGRITSVSDGSYIQPIAADIVVSAAAPPPPPPPPAAAPAIDVSLTPRPIETQARVTVVYAIQ